MGENKIVAKVLDFTIDFVLWASGILLIVFGSIALANPDQIINLLDLIPGVSNVTNIFNVMPLFEGVSIFMIVLGCFLFLCGGIGCCAIFKVHRKLHMMYSGTLVASILIEIALIIYAAVYPGTMTGWVEQEMNASLSEFQSVNISSTGDITLSLNTTANAWESLQFQTQCCGAYSSNDFTYFTQWNRNYTINSTSYYTKYPPSCCVLDVTGTIPLTVNAFPSYSLCLSSSPVSSVIITQSCSSVVMSMVWNFNYISIIICSCLIATELIGVALTARIIKSRV